MQRRGFWRPPTWMEAPVWQKSRGMSLSPDQHLRGVRVWSVALEPSVRMTRLETRHRGTETLCHVRDPAGMTELGVVSGISRATIWIGRLGVLGPWGGAELLSCSGYRCKSKSGSKVKSKSKSTSKDFDEAAADIDMSVEISRGRGRG